MFAAGTGPADEYIWFLVVGVHDEWMISERLVDVRCLQRVRMRRKPGLRFFACATQGDLMLRHTFDFVFRGYSFQVSKQILLDKSHSQENRDERLSGPKGREGTTYRFLLYRRWSDELSATPPKP